MTDVLVRAVMTGDSTGLVGAARLSSAEIAKLQESSRQAMIRSHELTDAQKALAPVLTHTAREFSNLDSNVNSFHTRIGALTLRLGVTVSSMVALRYAIASLHEVAGLSDDQLDRLGLSIDKNLIGRVQAADATLAGLTMRLKLFAAEAASDVINVPANLSKIWDNITGANKPLAPFSRSIQPSAMGLLNPGPTARDNPFITEQNNLNIALMAESPIQKLQRENAELQDRLTKQFAEGNAKFLYSWKSGGLDSGALGNAYDAFNPTNPNPGWTQSQKIYEEQATTDKILAIAKEANKRQQEMANELADQVVRSHVYMADSIRSSFDQMGASIILDFDHAGQAAMGFVQQLANLYIQEQIMGPLSKSLFGSAGTSLGGSIGDWLAGQLGMGGFPDSVAITAEKIGSNVGGFLGFHSGGLVGINHTAMRYIHPAVFEDAPRLHSGGLLAGERPIIARDGEGVFTPKQMDNADAVLATAMAAPKVNVYIYEAPGTKATVQQSQGADGGLNIEVMIDQMDSALADRQARGKSQFGRSIENSYSLRRTPS